MKEPINTNDLVREYLAGKSPRQLAEEFGLGVQAVRYRLAKEGIAVRGAFRKTVITDGDIDRWIADYEAGLSIQDLSATYGVHVGTIRGKFRERNVKFRTRADYTKRGKDKASLAVYPAKTIDSAVAAYVAGEGAKEISRRTGIPAGILYRRLHERGMVRDGSGASRAMYARLSLKERKRFTAAANRANVGRVHKPEELLRMAATRQANLSVAYPSETALAEALRGLGYEVIRQRALGTYNLDIALEELRVAVEVQSGSVASFLYGTDALKRLEYVLNQGWSVLFVGIRGKGFVFPDVVQKVLTFCDLTGRDKPCSGQYGVIRSDGKNFPRGGRESNGLPRVPGF